MDDRPVAIVVGGSGGLGKLIVKAISPYYKVIDWSLPHFDATNEFDVAVQAKKLPKGDPYALINCAGYNSLDWIITMEEREFQQVMDVNVKSIFLTAKYLADKMEGGVICNILSSAAKVPMTHSIAYNASKAAAAMMTRQMAKELWYTHQIRVFGVSPNKMKNTGMTEYVDQRAASLRHMSPGEAHQYQLSKIITGEETDPACVAEFVAFLLEKPERHRYLAGSILEYGI